MADCSNALKQWTGKASATIIYDSTVDEFTHDGLFEKVKGKPNIALVGFTTDGDVFGGFYSVAVTEQERRFFDPLIFAFSFESHGRCVTPQRFSVKEGLGKEPHVWFYENGSKGFVWFGVYGEGGPFLGDESSDSYCWQVSHTFEGLDDTTLTGKNGTDEGPFHHCARLVSVQLE